MIPATPPSACEDANRALAPISDHIYSLYALVQEAGVSGSTPADVGDWLILAAGLRDVSIVTNGLAPGDEYCSNVYEEARGPASAAVATELTRLLFLWGALQGLMRTHWGRRREQGQPRQMAMLIGRRHPAFLHQTCAAGNLLERLGRQHSEPEYQQVLRRARRLEASEVGQATFAAYQLRNSLAHGAVPWPDDNSAPAGPAVLLAATACRILTFAVQGMIEVVLPADVEVTYTTPDGEWREAPIGNVLPEVHLQETPQRVL